MYKLNIISVVITAAAHALARAYRTVENIINNIGKLASRSRKRRRKRKRNRQTKKYKSKYKQHYIIKARWIAGQRRRRHHNHNSKISNHWRYYHNHKPILHTDARRLQINRTTWDQISNKANTEEAELIPHIAQHKGNPITYTNRLECFKLNVIVDIEYNRNRKHNAQRPDRPDPIELVHVQSNTTMEDVAKAINAALALPPEEEISHESWRIVANKGPTIPTDTVESLGLQHGATLHAMPPLHGGYADEDREGMVRVACWNIQKSYNASDIMDMMQHASISYLALSEWRPPDAPALDDKTRSRIKGELINKGLASIITEHQLIIMEPSIFEYDSQEPPHITMDGRLVTHIAHRRNDQPIAIMSAYGVAQGEDSYRYSDGETKGSKRKHLHDETNKQYKRIITEHGSQTPVVLMGDLQETMTQTNADNRGEVTYCKHKFGLLKWALDNNMGSIGWQRRGESKYLTRHSQRENGGSRGIDHIVACGNADAMAHNFVIDKFNCQRFSVSDHDLLCCSLDMGYDHTNDEPEVEDGIMQRLFKSLSHIPVEEAHEKDKDSGVIKRKFNFKEPAYLSQRMKDMRLRFEEAIKFSGEDEQLLKLAKEIEDQITELENEIKEDAQIQNAKGNDGKLVKKSDKYRIKLNEIVTKYDKALDDIMNELNLTSEDNSLSERERRKAMLSNESKYNDELPAYKQLRWARRTVTRNIRLIKKVKKELRNMNADPQPSDEQIDSSVKDIQQLAAEGSGKMPDQVEAALKSPEDEMDRQKDEREAIQQDKGKDLDPLAGTSKQKLTYYDSTGEQHCGRIDEILKKVGCTNLISNSYVECEDYIPMQSQHESKWWTGPSREELKTIDKHALMTLTNEPEFTDNLKATLKKLNTIKSRIVSRQRRLWMRTLIHAALKMDTRKLSRMLIPTPRDQPAAHNKYWVRDELGNPTYDEETGEEVWAPCRSTADALQGTKDHHQRWASDSGGKPSALAEMRYGIEDTAAPEGIDLYPDRELNDSDLEDLLRERKHVSDEVFEMYKEAHDDPNIRKLYEARPDNPNLQYPFYYSAETGKFSDDQVEDRFWKAIEKVPGKERYETFTLNVLARLDTIWASLYLRIIQICLVTRTEPVLFKKITRIPIPKPKPGETRPLAICHDAHTFMLSEIVRLMLPPMEEANLISPWLRAYRKDVGTYQLNIPDICAAADAVEFPDEKEKYLARILEDEEKFFDRVPLIEQIAAMRSSGFPEQGYCEFKIEDMFERNMTIITNKGRTEAKYTCGLPQGQVLSCLISNLVLHRKHKMWRVSAEDPTGEPIYDDNDPRLHGYTFKHKDINEEERFTVNMDGYCDDNKRFVVAESLEQVVERVEHYIKMTGFYSLVSKIGRKSDKSEIHFYNLSPEEAKSIKNHSFCGYEWSFEKGKPIKQKLKIMTHIKDEYMKQPCTPKENEERQRLNDTKPYKQLGVKRTLKGESHTSGRATVAKLKTRLENLRTSARSKIVSRLTNNILGQTVASYEPLSNMTDLRDTNSADELLMSHIRRENGFSKNDSNHLLFVDPKDYGMGYKSATQLLVESVAREMEVVLNENTAAGKAIRSRLQAMKIRKTTNHVHDILQHHKCTLAKYGFYIRDRQQLLDNEILEWLRRILRHDPEVIKKKIEERGHRPIGDPYYKGASKSDRNKATHGIGDEALIQFALEEEHHKIIKNTKAKLTQANQSLDALMEEKWWPQITRSGKKAGQISPGHYALAARMAFGSIQYKAEAPYDNNYEWRISPKDLEDIKQSQTDNAHSHLPSQSLNWRKLEPREPMNENAVHNHPDNYHELTRQIQQSNRLDYNEVRRPTVDGNVLCSDKEILQYALHQTKSPLLVYTDGGSQKSNHAKGAANAAAMVLCIAHIKNNEDFESGEWQTRAPIPLITRIQLLPNQLGNSPTDNGHAEMMAINMAEELLPAYMPAAIITDSEVTLNRYKLLRDGNIGSDRNLIRNVLSGVSKACTSRLLLNLSLWSKDAQTARQSKVYNPAIPPDDIDYYDIAPSQYTPEDEYMQDELAFTHDVEDQEHWSDWTQNIKTPADDHVPSQPPWSQNSTQQPPQTSLFDEEDLKIPPYLVDDITTPPGELRGRNVPTPLNQRIQMLIKMSKDWITDDPDQLVRKGSAKTKPWKTKYHDDHPHRLILKVDSHQINDDGSPTKRYKSLTPCEAMVYGNQLADTAASMGTKKYPHDFFKNTTAPNPITDDPHGLRFYITYDAKAIDKNTPAAVQNAFSREMLLRHQRRGTHGLLSRISESLYLTPKMLGQAGTMNRVITGRATTHSQKMKRNPQYALLHAMRTDGYKNEEQLPKDYKKQILQDAKYQQCPFCVNEEALKNNRNIERSDVRSYDTPKGDMRHYQLFCNDPDIASMHEATLQALEEALQNLLKVATNLKQQYSPSTTNLKYKWTAALAKLEMESHKVAIGAKSPMTIETSKRKAPRSIIPTERWTNVTNYSKILQSDYPLCHDMGFIGALPDGQLQIQEANAADTLYLGTLPKALKEVINEYAQAITRGMTSKEDAKEARKDLNQAWERVYKTAHVKTESIAKCTRQRINNYFSQLKKDLNVDQEEQDEDNAAQCLPCQTPADESLTDKPKRKSKRQSTNQMHECTQPHCIVAHQTGQKPGKTSDPTAPCGKCNKFESILNLITNTETKLAEPSTNRAAFSSILRKELHGKKKRSTKDKLKDLEKAIYKTKEIRQDWLTIYNPANSDEKKAPKQYTDALRHLARTLGITIPSKYAGPDGPISKATASELITKANITCKCRKSQRLQPNRIEDGPPSTCDACHRLQKKPKAKANHCRACNKELDKVLIQSNTKTCEECRMVALITQNPLKARYQWQVEKARIALNDNQTSTQTEQYLSQTSHLCDPTLVPVNRILTPEEAWTLAAEHRLNVSTENKTTNQIIHDATERMFAIHNKKLKGQRNRKSNTTDYRKRELCNKGYNHNYRPRRNDLTYTKLTEVTTIRNITLKPATDLATLEYGRDLNDNCLNAALELIAEEHENATAIHSYFYPKLQQRGWTEAEQILPRYDPNHTLIIPIHTGGNTAKRHWTLLVRKKHQNRYEFYYYDSAPSKQRAVDVETAFETSPLYRTARGDKWFNIKCCPQQGRTCGPVTALNAALALSTSDHGASRQLAMKGIPNRGLLTHAWLKTCIDTESTASLLWIEEESIANSIHDPSSTQELETPKKIDLSTPKPKTRDSTEYPTPAEAAISTQSSQHSTLTLETPIAMRLTTPQPKRQRNHINNPTPAAFQRSTLKKKLFYNTPNKSIPTATPQISMMGPTFTPTPRKIQSNAGAAASPASTLNTPSHIRTKTYADAAASPAAIIKRTRLANTPTQPDRNKRSKQCNNNNKTPQGIRKAKAENKKVQVTQKLNRKSKKRKKKSNKAREDNKTLYQASLSR